MIKVIGREACSLCYEVKELLRNKNIQFEDLNIDILNPIDKFKYLGYAKQARQINLPIILVDSKFIKTTEFIAKLKGEI